MPSHRRGSGRSPTLRTCRLTLALLGRQGGGEQAVSRRLTGHEEVDVVQFRAPPSVRDGQCATVQDEARFPVRGVFYVPHMIGEPYPRPEADPEDVYDDVYSNLHKVDLPIIGHQIHADTLLMRPWTLSSKRPKEIFEHMSKSGVCKIIPTFHVAKYYAELLLRRGLRPDTDSNSPFFRNFVRFGASLNSNLTRNVRIAAWTVDLSLDLELLLKHVLDEETCTPEPIDDKNYKNYKGFLEIILNWVRQEGAAGSIAPALTDVPLLIPLDLSRISHGQREMFEKFTGFLRCFISWSQALFADVEGKPQTRLLVSFALPYKDDRGYDFGRWLTLVSQIAREQGVRIVVMVAAQALTADPINVNSIVEDYGNETAPPKQQFVLRRAFQEYERQASLPNSTLDGFILDEWQDDWDRGSRGPFYLALETQDQMREDCGQGGRFSHDVERCARRVGFGFAYPEFFGLAASHSKALQHCVRPRFHKGGLFTFPGGNSNPGLEKEQWRESSLACAYVRPSFAWVVLACALCCFILPMTMFRSDCRCCALDNGQTLGSEDVGEVTSETIAHTVVRPQEPRLCGDHKVELKSANLRSDQEAGWWLWAHLSVQIVILEKQVMAEVATRRALRERRNLQQRVWAEADAEANSDADSDSDSGLGGDPDAARALGLESTSDDLAAAMATIHRRVLEGFAAWCHYVKDAALRTPHSVTRKDLCELSRLVYENEKRKPARLFSEAVLLRTMESLAEQIIHCPERLSHLLFGVLLAGGHLDDDEMPVVYTINLDDLHCGLRAMQEHSNPYESIPTLGRRSMRGLNFDDINECGIQCREVTKTFREPASIMVVIDFFICYRVPFMTKMWGLFVAGYMYLGTGKNGAFLRPTWLRINFIQYTAMGDAWAWVFIEALLIVYVSWQRWPSLGHRSPGVPDFQWFTEHTANLVVSVVGAYGLYSVSDFRRKPPQCRDLQCEDPRSSMGILFPLVLYWLMRLVTFVLLHRRRSPAFLHGTPWRTTRRNAGRTPTSETGKEAIVTLTWVLMLLACILLEVLLLLPGMRGLSWEAACGFNFFGLAIGSHEQAGICSRSDHWSGFSCVSCITSIILAGMMVFMCSMVDIYFIFYVFCSIVGMLMGHSRRLNDLKNTSVLLDLRPKEGREAKRFEATFGPGWRTVWLLMVKTMFEDGYISPHAYTILIEASGLTPGAEELVQNRNKKMKPIHLTRFPRLVAERLAFFFHSLKWIESPNWPKMHFHSSTDSLTGVHFDPGTVPSLTQIIPAYNETVLPSVDFLRSGSETEDAMNQPPEGISGVGDRTDPPRGSGVSTNLAFMISQFPQEWSYLAKRLHSEGQVLNPSSHGLYCNFICQKLPEEVIIEVQLWAALRSQTVAKTVIGALQYGRALSSLPAFKKLYGTQPNKRVGEDHCEVILAHQTFGQNPPEGSSENDEAVRLLLMRYSNSPLFLVFDLTPNSNEHTWHLVRSFLSGRNGYDGLGFEYAGVKCKWDPEQRDLQILEVLPRKFPLRLGKGDFKTQGKAANQLNGLRFASGHYLQALDCNMGAFIGECFKVPHILRVFMPLDKSDRIGTTCRYLGFREYIYTERDGTVGKCHAAAEWTFGTIYQRFLSGLGTRMHYGHPDFLDGFWARNRGGMSKGSPVINLSEDIFAGYNVRMREENSPHIDALEFEKGREASFNAASNFFAKISGGSVAVIRSRDNHLLCERIGILHSFSFYFTSVAFYVSNLIIDMSTYLYVLCFVAFTLADIDLGRLHLLGSTFATEWVISLGIVTIIPQLFEMVLEFGAIHAIREVLGSMLAATGFFLFQNKNIASAMRLGASTGVAKYYFTGRPMANQHLTWKDMYVTYHKSHYRPAFSLIANYLVYHLLVKQTIQGKLPMMLIVITFTSWLVTPVVFSPFPRWSIIKADLYEFNGFIHGRAGMELDDLAEVVDRGQKGKVRTLFECGLADEMGAWSEQPVIVLFTSVLLRTCRCVLVIYALPSGIMDFMWLYLVMLSPQWLLVLGFFSFELNNILSMLTALVWPGSLFVSHWIIGRRASVPSILARMPEYVISFIVFFHLLGIAKQCILLISRLSYCFTRWWSPSGGAAARRRHHETVRIAYEYFFVHQLHCAQAYAVLVVSTLVSLVLALVDLLPGHPHTWWLMNAEMASTSQESQASLEKMLSSVDDDSKSASSSSSSSDGDDVEDVDICRRFLG